MSEHKMKESVIEHNNTVFPECVWGGEGVSNCKTETVTQASRDPPTPPPPNPYCQHLPGEHYSRSFHSKRNNLYETNFTLELTITGTVLCIQVR
jgi:hypothetical protein